MAGRFSVSARFSLTDRMSPAIGKIEKRVSRFARSASHELDRLDRGFGSIGKTMTHFGAVAVGGALAVGGAIASVVKPALELEEAMKKVETVMTAASGNITADLAKTRKAALEWSDAHVASAEEFLEANYNMASAGLDSEQALAGTTAALTLATATLGDAATAGNLLATVYNNMGDKGRDASEEMNHLGDVLAKTQAVFQIKDLAQLNESMKMGAPAAIQYGISIEQLSNAVGALNTAGLAGSQAGTSFAASMRNMLKASKALKFDIAKTADGHLDFAATLDNIKAKYGTFETMTSKQKMAFQKAFGDEGLRAISLLLGKTDEFNDSLNQIYDATGASKGQADIIESGTGKQLEILGNQLHNIAGEIGAALLPALLQLKPLIDNVVKKTAHWIEENQGLIASKAAEYVERFIAALPEIAIWMERIAYGIGIFYGMSAAIKAAQLAMLAFNGVMFAAKAGAAIIQGIAAANAMVAVTAAGASAGVSGMLAPIAASVGLTLALGAAAAAIGYAVGRWLIPDSWVKGLEDTLVDLMGIEDVVNKIGRSDKRGTGVKPKPVQLPTPENQSPAEHQFGDQFFGDVPAPSVVSPQERTARYYSEENKTMEDSLAVTIQDESGKAVVTKPPKRARLVTQPSGGL